ARPDDLWRFSTGLHCPDSDCRYADPQPALFSFNSAYGACDTCRGFGRVIGVDLGLVIPDHRKTLRSGAIKTIQTPAWKECKDDADAVMAPAKRFLPVGAQWSREQLEAMPGLTVHDLMMLPIDRIRGFFDRLSLPSGLLDEALKLLLDEVRTRLKYLCDVGI